MRSANNSRNRERGEMRGEQSADSEPDQVELVLGEQTDSSVPIRGTGS